MQERRYWVYIMAGAGHTIYVGMTNDLMRRVWEHKFRVVRGFTTKYNLDKLVYYAEFGEVGAAIAHEKRIKGWVRRKKDALIQETNPQIFDLAVNWYSSTVGDSSVGEPPSE